MSRRGLTAVVAVATGITAAVLSLSSSRSNTITGPYAALLADSVDLGPAEASAIRLTVAFRGAELPASLVDWARRSGLSLRWRAGDTWALMEGPRAAIEDALGVMVHDYRARDGRPFYASPQQPELPAALRDEVAGLGRIMSYTPYRGARPPIPREVPDQGLSPETLRRTYNARPLLDAGHTGKGVTVVVFAFDGFDQSDLDLFSSNYGLPRLVPEVVGGQPAARDGEATMDLQVIHALAPDARTVLVNALPTVQGDTPYANIAAMLEDTSRRYPGAVWSLSIGWGCDKLVTAADLEPVRAAMRSAHRSGTTAFDASGDLAGLECKGKEKWSAAPSIDNAGLDAVASIPEITSVGGTTLSTDTAGDWLGEQTWFDPPLSQGTGGGVSVLFDRPEWQTRVAADREGKRLAPDLAAVADPFTGVKIVVGGQQTIGGGTSLSAPIWAGLTAVINSYLTHQGVLPVGDLNPLLYRIPSVFHDITLGGNAVENAGPGYDLVTGLGTPDAEKLAFALLAERKAGP